MCLRAAPSGGGRSDAHRTAAAALCGSYPTILERHQGLPLCVGAVNRSTVPKKMRKKQNNCKAAGCFFFFFGGGGMCEKTLFFFVGMKFFGKE